MWSSRIAALVVLALPLAACTGTAGAPVDISAALTDGSITLSTNTIAAGHVTIAATNGGTMVHEIEVFAGEGTLLPVVNSVADTSGLDLIDEIEDVVPGATVTLAVDLVPGHYVIMCNLPGHYEMGMVADLEVTG